jgi:TolA-binding protein
MGKDALINFRVDEATREEARDVLDHGELSENLRRYTRRLVYGETHSRQERLEERLATLEEEREDLRARKREIEAQIEQTETEVARIRDQLTEVERQSERYDSALTMLEEILYAGGRVYPGHGQVDRAADLGDRTGDQVIEDLRERNPGIPDHAYVDGARCSQEWTGVEGAGADALGDVQTDLTNAATNGEVDGGDS